MGGGVIPGDASPRSYRQYGLFGPVLSRPKFDPLAHLSRPVRALVIPVHSLTVTTHFWRGFAGA